jgi:hypothetical protein
MSISTSTRSNGSIKPLQGKENYITWSIEIKNILLYTNNVAGEFGNWSNIQLKYSIIKYSVSPSIYLSGAVAGLTGKFRLHGLSEESLPRAAAATSKTIVGQMARRGC